MFGFDAKTLATAVELAEKFLAELRRLNQNLEQMKRDRDAALERERA